jgi:O-methyltransferase involved in polyketide biosynthesis
LKTVAGTGEPYRFGIPEGEIETFLSDRDYRLVRHLTAEDLEGKYLTDNEGRLHERICGHNCVALSQVAP